MGLDLDFSEGQTPIDEDEKDGLLIKTITTRAELNEFEQLGVEKAVEWSRRRKFSVELRTLLDDCRYWTDNDVFSPDETVMRFSHRIVSIHPFANGNGRHSRLIADILIDHGFARPPFTWGSVSLTAKGAARSASLKALRDADENDYRSLIEFARK